MDEIPFIRDRDPDFRDFLFRMRIDPFPLIGKMRLTICVIPDFHSPAEDRAASLRLPVFEVDFMTQTDRVNALCSVAVNDGVFRCRIAPLPRTVVEPFSGFIEFARNGGVQEDQRRTFFMERYFSSTLAHGFSQ